MFSNFEAPHEFQHKSMSYGNGEPFFQKYENFLSPIECQYLSKKTKYHPKNVKGAGLGSGFQNLHGFTTIFKNKLKAKEMFTRNLNLPTIWDIFERVILPDSNAFVINTLIIKKSSKSNAAVYPHYDDTLGVTTGIFKRDTLARYINILYIKLPHDMKNGNFVAWKKGISTTHEIARPIGLVEFLPVQKPVVYENPKVGTLLKIRGDMYHKVEPFMTNTDDDRISIVIEEYICTDSELAQIIDYEIN